MVCLPGFEEVNSGTVATVVSTEVPAVTYSIDCGVFSATIDLTPLQSGETVIVRLQLKIDSGASYQTVQENSYTYPQTETVKLSWPVPIFYGVQLTVEQTVGVSRSFDWILSRVTCCGGA